MKRRHLLAVVILLAMAGDLSAWSGVQRRDWWKLRERAFRAELARVEKNPSMDPAVSGLIRADIERAVEVVGMFERTAQKGAAPVAKPSGAAVPPESMAGAGFFRLPARVPHLLPGIVTTTGRCTGPPARDTKDDTKHIRRRRR
jgi:hypothetical protein